MHLDGEEILLTPTEYDILKLLMEHPGQVFSPGEIYRRVWNEPYGSDNTVAVHIRHLREKVEFSPADPRYIKVVWGRGSKASTGNLELHPIVTNVNLLSDQVLGEYRERLAEKNLELVQSELPDDGKILCDGPYLWRIFDNLLSNICKYSLPGTRVYFDIQRRDQKIAFVFRNISAVPLHITPDELTERFVRGDASRNTEGSGLGLSIAKSLAELQGATLVPEIDGDLFKVTLTFPEVTEG